MEGKNKMMEHRKINPINSANKKEVEVSAIERRYISEKVEYRDVDGSEIGEVFGYALKWDVEYDMGSYIEKVARGALDNADMSDIRVLDNHESHLVLGRTKSGTASVGLDNVGLWYRAQLPNSPNGQNMKESLSRGDIDQSSWGFIIRDDGQGNKTGEKWEKRDGKWIRTITDVATVFDTSPVTFPANPDTSSAKRSHNMAPVEQVDAIELRQELETWDIAWMVDNVAWATYKGNDMVYSLNNSISNYSYYAGQDTPVSEIFKALADSCETAKSAIVALIDAHIDALKTLNLSENRAADALPEKKQAKESRHTEDNASCEAEGQQTNTHSAAELLNMDIELLEAEMQTKNFIRL